MSVQDISLGTPWQQAKRREQVAAAGVLAEAVTLRQALGAERQARKVAEKRYSFLVHQLRGGSDLDRALADVEELFG